MSLVSNVPVQVEFHKDCELWAYPGSGEKVLLHDARGVHVEMELFGNAGGRLTFVLDATSPHFDAVIQDSRVYILFRRCGRDEGSFIIANCGRHRTNDGVIEEGAVEFMCLPVITELAGIRILPNLSASETSYTFAGYPDDGMKDCLRKQVVAATSYNDPGGNARELAGWQVAANKSEHGTSNADMEARGDKLLDKLRFWSTAHDFIDFDTYIVWSGGNLKVEFDTYYPRRGADRSRINTDGNDYVFLNDAGDNILNVQLHRDMTEERNAIYDEALTSVARDTGRRTKYGLREKVIKVHFANELTAALQRALDEYTVADGIEYTLTQTARFKYGQHFELGDKISHNNIYFGTTIKHEVVKHVTLDYDEHGFETLQLTMGNPEPDLIDRILNRMGGDTIRDYIVWGDDIQPVGSANAWTADPIHPNILFPCDDHIHRFGIADDSVAVVDPDANGIINIIGDGTVTATKTGANTLTLSTAHTHGLTFTPEATTNESAHTHGIGGSTGAGTSHSHSYNQPSTPTGNESAHTHGIGGSTGAGTPHAHGMYAPATDTGNESAHTHGLPANTGAGSAHSHGLTGATAATEAGLSGYTDTWTVYGAVDWNSNPVHLKGSSSIIPNWLRITGSAKAYVYMANDGAGGGAGWIACSADQGAVGAAPHKHALSGGVATGVCTSHTHGVGTLAVANESAHTHGIGGSTGAGTSHNHPTNRYWTATAGESAHTHGLPANTGAGSAHGHTVGTSVQSTGGESAHTHGLPANTGAGSAHGHSYDKPDTPTASN